MAETTEPRLDVGPLRAAIGAVVKTEALGRYGLSPDHVAGVIVHDWGVRAALATFRSTSRDSAPTSEVHFAVGGPDDGDGVCAVCCQSWPCDADKLLTSTSKASAELYVTGHRHGVACGVASAGLGTTECQHVGSWSLTGTGPFETDPEPVVTDAESGADNADTASQTPALGEPGKEQAGG